MMSNNSGAIQCLICKSGNISSTEGVISDFLLERIWNNKHDAAATLCACADCGFAWWEPRFTDDEVDALYRNYRDAIYQKVRAKHESWYTEEINSFSDDPKSPRVRDGYMNGLLTKNNVPFSEITRVLDYGGDTGKHIPSLLSGSKKYVFDVSAVQPVGGVIGLNTLAQAQEIGFDYVQCCHVLEHVTDFSDVMAKIKSTFNNNNNGGWFYLEVPFELSSRKMKYLFNYIRYLFNPYFSLRALIDRFVLNLKKPHRMHEHINFFTPKAVTLLLKNNGFTIIDVAVLQNDSAVFGKGEVIGALAKLEK